MIAALSIIAILGDKGTVHTAHLIDEATLEDVLEAARIRVVRQARTWERIYAPLPVSNPSMHLFCDTGDAYREVLTEEGWQLERDDVY